MTETKKAGNGQILKLALVLLAVAAVIALVLGLVNEITKGPIDAYLTAKRDAAYSVVMDGAADYEELASDAYTNDASNSITTLSVAKDASATRWATSRRPPSPARRA